MHLIHHPGTNATLDDLFKSIPEHNGGIDFAEMLHGFSEIESEFEATEVQRDISKEAIQWASAELILPNRLPTFQAVFNAWNSLASYR
jgi:hypothetical protein